MNVFIKKQLILRNKHIQLVKIKSKTFIKKIVYISVHFKLNYDKINDILDL